jgi:Peptidase family M23
MIRDLFHKRPEGRWVVGEFDRYAKVADQLRKNHASGPLDDKEVRELLRRVGLTSTTPRPAAGAPRPAPPKPFAVPVYRGGYRWPLDGGLVTSEFGQRRGTAHQGLDIAADRNVPVYAAAEGEVIYADSKLGGYGNAVTSGTTRKRRRCSAQQHAEDQGRPEGASRPDGGAPRLERALDRPPPAIRAPRERAPARPSVYLPRRASEERPPRRAV